MHPERVLAAGEPLQQAQAALVLLHGRGATAQDIMLVGREVLMPGVACLAPQATGNTWYPHRYADPIESNEPWLSAALAMLDRLLAGMETSLPASRVVLLGFSQGACLTLEFAARRARRYGAVVGLSGALIGPPGTPRDYPGSLSGTPVFIGCSDDDPHVAAPDVLAAGGVLRRLGGEVTVQLYPGLGHTVGADEIERVRGLLAAVVRTPLQEDVPTHPGPPPREGREEDEEDDS